jgi:hypothetical protein
MDAKRCRLRTSSALFAAAAEPGAIGALVNDVVYVSFGLGLSTKKVASYAS